MAQPLESRKLFAAIPAGTLPQAYLPVDFQTEVMIANPVRNEVYVGDATNNTVHILDTEAAREVGSVPVWKSIDRPAMFAVSPDGKSLAIADYRGINVQIVSVASRKTIKQYTSGFDTHSLAFGVENTLYGETYEEDGTNEIAVISLDTGKRLTTIGYQNAGQGIDYHSVQTDRTGTRLYAINDKGVAEFDISTPNRISSTPTRTFAIDYAGASFVDRQTNHIFSAFGPIRSTDMNSKKTVEFKFNGIGEESPQNIAAIEGMSSLWTRTGTNGIFEFRKSDGRELARYQGGGTGVFIQTLAQTPNGRLMYTSTDFTSDGSASAFGSGIGIIGSSTLTTIRAETTVRGFAYLDKNTNGLRESAETSTLDCYVYVDLDNDGKRDQVDNGDKTDEPAQRIFAGSSANEGQFEIDVPAAGTYTLRIDSVQYSGTFPVATNQSALTVTVAKGDLRLLDIGLTSGGVIEPTFFIDTNKNGTRDSNENPGGHPDLFLDLNRNGKFDAFEPVDRATQYGYYTRDNGTYASPHFVALAGTYDLRMLPDTNSDITLPAIPVTVKSGKTINLAIGVLPPRVLSGRLYHDLNANGVRETYETAFEYVGVWLDLDGNGHRDAGEPSTHTKGNGSYTITTNHAAHNVAIRYVTTDGKLTSTSTRRRVNLDGSAFYLRADAGVYLSARVALDVFADANKNGKRDKRERSLAGVIVYLDLDKDGRQDTNEPTVVTDANGRAMFADLTPGQYRVTARISSKSKATTATSFTLTAARDALAAAAVGVS